MSNVVTNVGLNDTAKMVGGTATVDPFKYIAIGTGTTDATASDTALEAEITSGGGKRVSVTPNVSNGVLTLSNTFNFTSSFAITEAGVFNAATGGDMYGRAVFNAINVNNGDSLQITIKITYSQG